MSLPDFLVIGAARSGTTSLYHYLKSHPQVYLPAKKHPEPHFFLKNEEYKKGIDYYSNKYFKNVNHNKKAGEISTSYIYQPYVAKRIKKHLTNVKIIAMLRNPIERSFSNYVFTYNNGLDSLSFEEAILQEKERIANPGTQFHAEVQPYAYMDRGRYYKQLTEYLKLFSPDQIHIILFEDFIQKTLEELKKVFNFLGVDSTFTPPGIGKIYFNNNYDNFTFKKETRMYIYNELKDDIKQLSQWLNKDLSKWK